MRTAAATGKAAGTTAGGANGCLIAFGVVGALVLGVAWFSGQLAGLGLPGPGGSSGSTYVPTTPPPTVPGVTLGTGDVQATLTWDNAADLDLHVTDPSFEEIYFGHRTSGSGGTLDVDAHGGCGSEPPVENVFWPTGGAPSGAYTAVVRYFSACSSSGPATYTLVVRVNGVEAVNQSGTLSSGEEATFSFVR